MKPFRFQFAMATAILLVNFSARADLKLAAIFGDNMILQQQMAVPIWGWADSNTEVIVKFSGQTKSTRASANGKWLVKLGKLKTSFTPKNLIVEADETEKVYIRTETGGAAPNSLKYFQTKTFTNILVGEVWLASGQSNMEKPIGNQSGQKPVFNAEHELAAANFPNIRIFQVTKTLAATPLDDLQKFHGWQECNSNALDSISFSAAAYFFGREIHTNLNVPVGLVQSTWGGTRIEPWTSPVGFEQISSQAKFAQTKLAANRLSNARPLAIYNAMIAPLAGFAMRGVIWYQGESNANEAHAYRYRRLFRTMIEDWRARWGEADMPFLFVQLANFKANPYWPVLRESQTETLSLRNTGMALAIDIGDSGDVHPKNKQDVGHRLALAARHVVYHEPVEYSGPMYRQATAEAGQIRVWFSHADGLQAKGGGAITGFTIAGADGNFVPAEARLDGNTVVVSSAQVANPAAVRYAWADDPVCNLINQAGLPAHPFRSDEPHFQ
jgi:sialate O-acetylesterase